MQVPVGRFEHRIQRTQVLELVLVSESPIAKVAAFTENVSPRGARIITDSACAPGKLVRFAAVAERLNLMARVVYCQRLDDGKFAVGLRLDVRVEEWQRQEPAQL